MRTMLTKSMAVGRHKTKMSPGGLTRRGRVAEQRRKPWQDGTVAHVENGEGIT
jgi:hypothetical protein